MYQPPHFREEDLGTQHALIRAHPLGIVGVEIEISEIEGKWKVSQNRPVGDREGVAAGLDEMPGQGHMAELVRRCGALRNT